MDKRQELLDACRSAQLVVEAAIQEDGQWTDDGKNLVSDIISQHLVDPSSILSAATLTSVCHSLLKTNGLSESLIVSLLQEVQTHNSLDYLQQVVVDVIEDLQELENSRQEEKGKVAKDSSVELKQSDASRSVRVLQALLDSAVVSASDAAHLVDSSRLSTFGLISSQPRHNSLEKRKRTNRFYRQKKYTLIRECSEGWARLIVLLADESAIGPGANGTNTSGEPEIERNHRARTLWRKVVALIGYYDLSPARVLDIILDAFCHKLASHWRFFLELLEHSPWGVRNMGSKGKAKELVRENEEDRSDTEFADDLDLEGGNLILTQVLGFKFGTYQEPERDLKGAIKDLEATPKELTLVTAILIKHRLVRTLDILPYLTPNDQVMEDLEADFAARVRREMGGSGNALTQSGALKDDDSPSTSANASGQGAGATNMTSEEIDNLPRQRVMLCESLLAIGHLPPAMFMLSKWPVMAQSSELVSDLLLRVVQYSLEPAYQTIARSEGDAKRGPNYRMHFPFAVPEPTLTTISPEPAPTEKKRFVFFYNGWQENIQRWHRIDEVVAKVTPFAKFVGPQGARNVAVLVWLCRIGVAHQQTDDSEQTKKAWLDIMRVLVLPSMPLLKSNYSFNIEVWPLLQRMETSQRHALYGEWHAAISNPMHSRYMPVMAAAAAQTTTEVKRILKRMTTSYDRVHARAIGKFSYSAPTALWSVILPQITSYQNMKTTVVESARYLSDFGWDVTIFMLLDALTNESKTAVKQDGTSASTWLIGVAAFIGQLAKRYSAMNLNPFFHLILNQLARDNLSGLITLKHIVSAMAGIDPIINVSPDQVKCFSGGAVLYVEGVEATRADYTEPPRAILERTAMAGVKPQRKQNNTKARNRLLVSLESSGLTVPLLIAMCQARKSCIFTATSASEHNKQLVTSMDECHSICNQFIRFLHNTMSKEKYAQFLPAFGQLHSDYLLDIAMAYQLVRPKLHWQLYNREEYLRVRLRKYRKDLSPEQESLATWDDQDWQAPLWPIMSDTALFVSEEVRASQLVPFHVTFWQLSLGEIACPDGMYSQVIKRLKDVARDLEDWAKPGVALDADWSSAYRANRSAILSKVEALTAEHEEQSRIAKEADERIDKESVKWFPECASVQLKHKLGQILHRECFYPRAIFSMSDATFVAQIGLHLHKKRVPNFSLLIFYDKFFGDALPSCIFSCSEAQATNLGRCLGLMLKDIEVWRASKTTYNEQALGSKNEETGQYEYQGMRLFNNEYLTWEKWGNMVYKWHKKILKAITVGLHAGDYLHIKNTIHVARNLLPAYPKVKSVFSELTRVIREFIDAETRDQALMREDLHLAVKSYEDALTLANRDSTFIIPDDQFFIRIARPGQVRASTSRPMEVDGSQLAKPVPVADAKIDRLPSLNVQDTKVPIQDASVTGLSNFAGDSKAASSEGVVQKPLDEQASKSPIAKNINHTEATLSLRDALLRKSERARLTPPSDAELQRTVGNSLSGSPLTNGVDAANTSGPKVTQINGAMSPGKSIPREPRSKDSLSESKQLPLRTMEPPAAPRGPISISRQAPIAGIGSDESKQAMASDRPDYRDKPNDAQAPATPRHARDRDDRQQTAHENHARNDHVTSSVRSATGTSRKTSPGRLAGSRSGSVDSKYSRASDHHRDQDRRSDRRTGERDRDRYPDRERDRAREPEKDRDTRKEKEQDKSTERASNRDRDHGHRSERHRPEDNGRERRREARDRDDKRDDKPKREERRSERERERRDRDRDRPRDRDRGKDRDDKDRSRPSRKDDEREREKEKEKEKDKERPRERERGERVNDKEREKDDRDRARDIGRRDRDIARGGDGDRDRYQGRNRDRIEKDARSRDERDTAGDTDSRRSDRSAGGSSLEVRSSIDALSRRFDAQRQHSISDSRATIMESAVEPVRTTPQPRELIGSAFDARKPQNGSEGKNGDAPASDGGSNGIRGSGPSRTVEATPMKSATPTLSSRLGPRIESDNTSRNKPASPSPMNHPLPGKPVSTGSSLASALALAAGGISPDLRKRPVEEPTANEGTRGSAAPSSANKRTRIDRQGARERGERATAAGAFSRLSGGMVNNGSTASTTSSRRE